MDKVNKEIINVLSEDSRTPFLKIAKSLNVSEGMIRQRVKKLIESKEIKKFTILKEQSLGAIVGLKTNPKLNLNYLEKKLSKLGFERVFHVSGKFDLVLETSLKGNDLNIILDKIRMIEGVESTETFIVLNEVF